MDKWINHPTSLKIIALAIGLLLWAVVHFDPEAPPNQVASTIDTRVFEAVKIGTAGLNPEMQHLQVIEPSVVRLLVEGNLVDLQSAAPEDYKVWVDLSDLGEGEHDLVVRYDMPPRVRLRELSPVRVKVNIIAVQTKEFEVNVKTTGIPADGYKIGTPIVKPNNRVFIRLPKDRMDRVAQVSAMVDVNEVAENVVEKKVRIIAYDSTGTEMKDAVLNPSVIEVEVPITKPFKKLPLQVGFTGRLQTGLSIASFKPAVDSVTVYGPQAALDKLEFYEGTIVNLAAITKSGTVSLDLKTPSGLASVDPKKLEVAIEVEPSETITLPQIPVTVTGLPEGLNATFVTVEGSAVDLNVLGAPSVLSELTAKDVQAIANLNGLPTGRHLVPLDVHLPQFVSSATTAPPTVLIDITDGTETTATTEGEAEVAE